MGTGADPPLLPQADRDAVTTRATPTEQRPFVFMPDSAAIVGPARRRAATGPLATSFRISEAAEPRRSRFRGGGSVRLNVGVRGRERRQRRAAPLDRQQLRERGEIDVEPAPRVELRNQVEVRDRGRVADQEGSGRLARDGLDGAEPARDVIPRDLLRLGEPTLLQTLQEREVL